MEFEFENEIKEQPEPKGSLEGYWDEDAKVLSLFAQKDDQELPLYVCSSLISGYGFSRSLCKADGDIPVRVKKIILEAL